MPHPWSEPTEHDYEEITDVDFATRGMNEFEEATPHEREQAKRMRAGDTVEDFRAFGRPARSLIPSTSEILELTGNLVTPSVAAHWRDMAQVHFEAEVRSGRPPKEAAEEAVARYIPMSNSR